MSKESVVEPQEESAPTETQPVADTPVAAAEPDTEVNGGEGLDDENTVEEDADLADSISDKTKGELLEMLAQIIAERPVQDIRREVEAIKIAFYKRHRAEVDALRKAFAAEHGEDAEFAMEPDADESRFKDLLRTYRTKRDEFAAVAEKAKEENYKIKLEIIEELKNLVKNEETLNNTFAKFRELQARWKETGQVPQQYVKDLWETYNLHVENFYDFVKINKELRDLDWKKNLELKTALCEQAERLAEEPSVVEAFRKLQKLHDDWREIGPVASEYKEALWERFKEASSKINRSHQEFFENLKAEQLNNLERKTALCEQVEALAADSLSSHKTWNRASEKLLEIQKEWKTIGFAPKKDNTKVYERFRAACDAFFARKREFYSEVKDDMEKNLRLKEEICEAAEKLQESEEWKAATDELLALQARWKEIGAVSRRHSDAIWKRFRAACDKFFERKSAHFASVENEYAENLRKKSELIEQMLVADIKEGGHDMIKEFQRRWSEIGYVPIKHKDELQKRYKEAVDKLFGALRGSDREQSMSRFKEKVSSLRSAGDKRLRTERDKLYNRVRQLEQEIALLENNIGFFSKSKGAEALIADVQEKIARAKRDMADAIAKVKMIDGEQ
ncbi:MAG: DUF349 domain-containing protein [Alistipes sp.]|nr:DUF349 domain-containing protein [Alistipes sp.]